MGLGSNMGEIGLIDQKLQYFLCPEWIPQSIGMFHNLQVLWLQRMAKVVVRYQEPVGFQWELNHLKAVDTYVQKK